MYIGPDGKVYQNKFDSLGHSTKMPGYAEEQRQINDRLHELRQRQSEAIDQRQNQELRQQQIDTGDRQNFYDNQREYAGVHGQPYGMGPGQAGQQRSGQAGYGMPMERKETVVDPLVQDAGKLNRMLQKYHQGQDSRDAEDAIGFINQHPGISANNVTGIRFNHSDRNEDPLVSLLGDDGNPVKQFYLSSLSNLNNFAGQKQQHYNPGRQVKEPEEQMRQLQAMAQQLAAQELAGESEGVRKKEMPAAIQHHFQQLMKQYGPANPGYEDTGFSQPNQTPGFGLFDNRQQGPEGDYLAYLQKMLGGGSQVNDDPPPPGTPATATPKQGSRGYNFGNNNAPGTWRNFNPSYGR
ncbi:hypothetical protein ACTL6P_04680 [Endozoicomonas acroporae]|uniref:hypothetical protein n=1 Tax=Endozoicomonas acroporae TaxID=1701104 RepID=UPI000C77D59A|nr:hypothetical protein [Endozoicomonas acroporae]